MKLRFISKQLKLYPHQMKIWMTKNNYHYTGGTVNYGLTDTSILQALIKGFAALGEGMAAVFSFGQSVEFETPDYLTRTNKELLRSDWEAIGSDWKAVGDDMKSVMDDLPPLRRDRHRLRKIHKTTYKEKKKNDVTKIQE